MSLPGSSVGASESAGECPKHDGLTSLCHLVARVPCICRQLFYSEQVGKAKEKIAREEARKAEARDDFTRLLRHTKSLKLDCSWEDIKPDLETHTAYKEVHDFLNAMTLNIRTFCV